MANPVEFYFDFSSTYGYLAATRIRALAEKYGRAVSWRPMLLGAVLKVTGGVALPHQPMKGDYAKHDMPRCARFLGIPFQMPSKFPISSQAPARAIYWIEQQAPDKVEAAVLALYRAYMVEDRDISSPEVTADVLAGLGYDRAQVLAALNDAAIKERLRAETQRGIERNVFGSPHVFVDGEPFWGHDRFDQVERWLRDGPF